MPEMSTRTGETCGIGAPYYQEREQAILQRFIAACLVTAEHSLKRTKEIAKGSEEHPLFRGQIAHWSGVVAGLKWAGSLTRRRQPHLLNPDDGEIVKWIERFQQLPTH